jgi:hypothetical protein
MSYRGDRNLPQKQGWVAALLASNLPALPPDQVGERNLEIGQFGKPPKDGYPNPVLTPPLFFGHRLRARTHTADPRREGARGTSCSAMGRNPSSWSPTGGNHPGLKGTIRTSDGVSGYRSQLTQGQLRVASCKRSAGQWCTFRVCLTRIIYLVRLPEFFAKIFYVHSKILHYSAHVHQPFAHKL